MTKDHTVTVMFSKHPEHVLADLSIDLRDEQDWELGRLRILDFPLDITSLAVEPVIGLLAVGMYVLGFATFLYRASDKVHPVESFTSLAILGSNLN